MAVFKASPSVGDEISKKRNRYRFDGIGWTPINRAQSYNGSLLVTASSWIYKLATDQTVITGNDVNSIALSYDTNAEITVYYNGVRLKEGSSEDYVLTNSSTITLSEKAIANDEVEILQKARFNVVDVSDTDLTDYYMGNL